MKVLLKLLREVTVEQWTLIFIFSIWVFSLTTLGITISILMWCARHGARVVLPAILCGFLASNCPAQTMSTYDQRGVVTMVLQKSVALNEWSDTAYRVEVLVNTNSMIGQVAMVYSNATLIASIPMSQTLVESAAGPAQLLDLSSYIQLPTDLRQAFVRWRIPTHDITLPVTTESTIVVLACGVVVLVIGGIAIYHIVKACNRLLTNNQTNNVSGYAYP